MRIFEILTNFNNREGFVIFDDPAALAELGGIIGCMTLREYVLRAGGYDPIAPCCGASDCTDYHWIVREVTKVRVV